MGLAEERCQLILSLLRLQARPQAEFGAFRAAITPATAEKPSLEELANDPGKIGLAIVNAGSYQGGNAAKDWSRAAYEICPEIAKYNCVISLIASNTMAKETGQMDFDEVRASSLGIEVVYDPDGCLGLGPVDITNGSLFISESHLEFDGSQLSNPSQRVLDLARVATLRDIAIAANKFISYSGRDYWARTEPLYRANARTAPEIAETLTFGEWIIDGMHDSDGEVLDVLGHLTVSNLSDTAAVKKMRDVCSIWDKVITSWGFNFSLDKVMATGKAAEAGRALGVDSFVDAYLSGVPVEDVLA